MPESDEQDGRNRGIRSAARRLRKVSEDALKKTSENLDEVQDAAQQRAKSTAESAKGAAKSLTERAATGVDAAQEAASQAAESATKSSRQAVSRVSAATTGAARAARDAVADAVNTDITIAAFKFPTGPREEDYCLVFDLDEVFEVLHRRNRVRPTFQVWAAAEQIPDPDLLGHQLWINFVHQYEEERDASLQGRFSEMEVLEKEIADVEENHNRVVEERTNISICATLWLVGLSIALFVVAIVTIPFTLGAGLVLLPVTVVGLWWAKRRVNKIERLMKEEGELEARRKVLQRQYGDIEKELHSEMNRLDKAFNLTEGRFRNAATEFYVRPHQQIVDSARVIHLAEGSPRNPYPAADEDDAAPDIHPFVQTDFYVRWVPEQLQAPIQAWVDSALKDKPSSSYQAELRSLAFLASDE